MKIYINSKFQEIPDNVETIELLLDHLKVAKEGTGVGVNNVLIPSKEWSLKRLNPEDNVIIITATYGG